MRGQTYVMAREDAFVLVMDPAISSSGREGRVS